MPGFNLRRRSAIPLIQNGVLLLCLLAPSLWMIANIPPLWRDADAYVQLTEDPRVARFWNHAPAYPHLAKLPLFGGEQWERIRGQPVQRIYKSQPALTDSGIWLLIIAQHLGLGIAAFRFITAVSRFFWIRLALAVIWASNALFYTFAHCVGSETLGVILIIVLVTKALRLVQHNGEPAWSDWYLYALALLFCLLTRDLNVFLVALLPLTFLISWTWKTIARKWRHTSVPSFDLRHAAIAIAVGIASVVITHTITQNLARRTNLHPHSRIGFTFLWRLHFLSELPPDARTALLDKTRARAPSQRVRELIALLAQMHREHADLLNTGPFMERAIKIYGGPLHWEELDLGLNQMACAFLWPPSPELLHAARTDFVGAVKLPSTVISEYLFATTSYYFDHKDEMPACAGLVTFRGSNTADSISQLAVQHRYFQLWQRVTYLVALAIWLVALLAFGIAAWRGQFLLLPTIAFSIALTIVGLTIFGAACLVHDFEPRFAVSMWELLLLSIFVLVGNTFEKKVRRAAVRPEP